MSHLLDMLEPFRENMRIFSERYNAFNDILKIVNGGGFGHSGLTQEEYYIAAEDPIINLGRGQAEGLKNDFINICETLLDDANQEGSIKHVVHLMNRNDFILDGISDEVADQYADYQYLFESKIGGIGKTQLDLTTNGEIDWFLEGVADQDTGVYGAIGDVDDSLVQEGINSFKAFLSFLEREALLENVEDAAGASFGLYTRKHSHNPRRRRRKRSTRTKRKKKKGRKRRSTRGRRKKRIKKRTRGNKDRY